MTRLRRKGGRAHQSSEAFSALGIIVQVPETSSRDRKIIVIGGGPAGLTAAYELTNLGQQPVLFEQSDQVGGIARTEKYKGFYFDMGGHRFFTKSATVRDMWHDLLGADFLRRPRLSRIYYRGKFFYYPLRPLNALVNLGPFEGLRVAASYLRWHLFAYPQEDTFEQWVTNRFGRRLFDTFFKSYTEKVWGIPTSELKAEWAAQRIKGLSLRTAIFSMFQKPGKTIATLIEEFDYPRLGPGMLWQAVEKRIEQRGGEISLNSRVVRIHRQGKRIESVVVAQNGRPAGAGTRTVKGANFISSIPVTALIACLDPPAPESVQRAAAALRYRDFLTVCLIINRRELFPDNWIYIHDPEVRVGRIQNFKNWSPDMVPDPAKTSLGLEYFCTEGDELWTMSDEDLVELGRREVARIGLADLQDFEDGCVFRVAKSYPIYDSDYREALAVVKAFVNGLENCQTIGRNGLHRYDNQDHAMLTGIYAVHNILNDKSIDLWAVNTDQAYHEEAAAGAPPREKLDSAPAILGSSFSSLEP